MISTLTPYRTMTPSFQAKDEYAETPKASVFALLIDDLKKGDIIAPHEATELKRIKVITGILSKNVHQILTGTYSGSIPYFETKVKLPVHRDECQYNNVRITIHLIKKSCLAAANIVKSVGGWDECYIEQIASVDDSYQPWFWPFARTASVAVSLRFRLEHDTSGRNPQKRQAGDGLVDV